MNQGLSYEFIFDNYESDNPPDSWLNFGTRIDIPNSTENPSESSVPNENDDSNENYDSFSGDQNETAVCLDVAFCPPDSKILFCK